MTNVYLELLKSTLLSEEERYELESEYADSIENDMIEADLKILELGLDSELLFDERLKSEIKIEEEIKMTNLTIGMVVSVEFNYSEVVGTVTDISGNSDAFYLVDEKGTEYKFYSDIHKVTIIDEKVFHGMENVEIVNESDYKYFDSAYIVSVYAYSNEWFGVYANCEQDALDLVVDYLVSDNRTGFIYTPEEVLECEKDGFVDMFIVAGNECYSLDVEHLQIEQIK